VLYEFTIYLLIYSVQLEVMDGIAGEADHIDRQSEHDEQDRHSLRSDHDQNAADPEGSKFILIIRSFIHWIV